MFIRAQTKQDLMTQRGYEVSTFVYVSVDKVHHYVAI